MAKLPDVFVFDIETGGLKPAGERGSSILSASYQHSGIVNEVFARPQQGTWLSEFSRKNIMPQVESAGKTLSEKALIQSFIAGVQETPAGAPLVGYNIQGFDLPFLRSRARQHGLESSLSSAMSGRRVLDVGLRTKKILGESITEHLQRGTFTEELGGRTWGQAQLEWEKLAYEQRPPEYRMLKQMESFGRQVERQGPRAVIDRQARGWKLEQMFPLIDSDVELVGKAHQSSADVQMTRRLYEAIGSGELEAKAKEPAFAKAWLKSTVEGLKNAPTPEQKAAGAFYHADTKSRLLSQWDNLSKPTRKFIGGTALLGASLLTVGAITNAFSGSDDRYNTIEGLDHRGIASSIRKGMTDFGSGYRGILALPRQLEKYFPSLGMSTTRSSSGLFMKFAGEMLKDRASVSEFASLGKFALQAGQRPFKATVVINRGQVAKEAAAAGKKYSEQLKETIKHERLHQAITEQGLGDTVRGFDEVFKSDPHLTAAYKVLKRRDYDEDIIPEEILAHAVEGEWWSKVPAVKQALDQIPIQNLATGAKFSRRVTFNLENYIDSTSLVASASSAVGIGFLALTGKELAENAFSGKDDTYNTVEGLSHKGTARSIRKEMTDFGSGYQGEDDWGVDNFAAGALGGYTAAYLAFPQIAPKAGSRLEEIRKIGQNSGFKVMSSQMASLVEGHTPLPSKYHKALGKLMFSEMNPASKWDPSLSSFSGVVYARDEARSDRLPLGPRYLNTDMPDIGRDKAVTWKYFQEKGIADLHAPSILGSEFYTRSDGNLQMTDAARRFVEEAGGADKLVVKRVDTALGKDVFLDSTKMPQEAVEAFQRNPENWIVQQRLDLAAEYRAITVGDQSIYSAHRFGPKWLTDFADKIGMRQPNVPGIGTVRWSENTIPVLDAQTRQGLDEFAEKVSRSMPYEIGAFDIGLTKAGEFKIIEAQRSFGSISNPIVARRLKHAITGGSTPLKGAVGALGAVAAFAGYSMFSGKDDAYNTIEGLSHKGTARSIRREMTDFGSGFIGRLAKTAYVGVKEITRETVHLSKEITRSALGGEGLALGVIGAAVYEAGSLGMTVANSGLTVGALGATAAGFAATKYAYVGIKHRKMLGNTAIAAYQHPRVAKVTAGAAGHSARAQLVDYLFEGKDNSLAAFVELGGGDIGRQAVLGRAELIAAKGKKLVDPVMSGNDDAHNVIEGLAHGGLAQELRKFFTPFGSGWDALRGLVKAGETFEKMVGSKSFQSALSVGKEGKVLASGAAGRAVEVQATFRGKDFSFIRKYGEIGSAEAKTARQFQDTFAPSVYGEGFKSKVEGFESGAAYLDIEMFSGKTFGAAKRDLTLTPEQITEAGQNIRAMHKAGISHGDFHWGNAFLTDEGKVGIIDFGLSGQMNTPKSMMTTLKGEVGYRVPLDRKKAPFTYHTPEEDLGDLEIMWKEYEKSRMTPSSGSDLFSSPASAIEAAAAADPLSSVAIRGKGIEPLAHDAMTEAITAQTGIGRKSVSAKTSLERKNPGGSSAKTSLERKKPSQSMKTTRVERASLTRDALTQAMRAGKDGGRRSKK